jgi:hypothetical protein
LCGLGRESNEAANPRRTGRKAMEWFGRTTSIAGVQIPNWGIVLGAAVIVILFIYSAFIH